MRRANFSRVVSRWRLSLWPLVWLLAVIPGVAADQESRQQQRATAAKLLFEQTVKDSVTKQINLTYLAFGAQDQSPAVGNGLYRSGWHIFNVGLGVNFDQLYGWVKGRPQPPAAPRAELVPSGPSRGQ